MPSTTVESESVSSAVTTGMEPILTGVEPNTLGVEGSSQSVPSESNAPWEAEMEPLDPAKDFATSLVREMLARDRVGLFVVLQIEWRDTVLIV